MSSEVSSTDTTGQETVVALGTASTPSALAVVRVSGPGCFTLSEKFLEVQPKPRFAHYANFTADDQLIDDVVATYYKGPASYTGEDLLEISCHGNMLIVDRIIAALCKQNGVRQARPGEFTQRAFFNGKMDLTQAEAVMDIISAESERSLAAARRLQEGKLGKAIRGQRDELLDILSHLEAYIDFPDEDISPEVGEQLTQRMCDVGSSLEPLLAAAEQGRWLREGLKVSLVGAPNAGKSSLLNTLLQRDRAIVSDLPGTTRDTIEESLFIEGIRIRLVDTAGVRDSEDPIEQLGIERTRKAIGDSALIVSLVDGSDKSAQHLIEIEELKEKNLPVIACLSKCDLEIKNKDEGLHLSAETGEGLEALKVEIAKVLRLSNSADQREFIAINSRHEELLTKALSSLDRALELMNAGTPELLSSDLRQTVEHLDDIVGQSTNEDILDRLFQHFCIGK